jgi:hypothetical protein
MPKLKIGRRSIRMVILPGIFEQAGGHKLRPSGTKSKPLATVAAT